MLVRSSQRCLAVGSLCRLGSGRRWALVAHPALHHGCHLSQHCCDRMWHPSTSSRSLMWQRAAPDLAAGLLPPIVSACGLAPHQGHRWGYPAALQFRRCILGVHCARPVLELVPLCIRAGLLSARLGVPQSLLGR